MASVGSQPRALARLFAWVPVALPGPAFARLRALLFLLAMLPLVRLIQLGVTDRLGANPVEFVTRWLGTWALVMLCVTLTITPLRQLTGWAWLVRLRRMAGLFCFFYAVLHVTTYAVLDHWFDLHSILADIVKRPYITAGFAAFVMLLPLAATSTNAMVKRLGARNWQRLHKLVYVIALAAILHFWWQRSGKNDFAEPTVYAIVIGGLLGVRLARWFSTRPRPTSRSQPDRA